MERAESLFREWGVSKITYLLVPEYHGGYPGAGNAAFRAFCLRPRPFGIEWHLHGYHHLESPPPPGAAAGKGDGWKRRFMTAGEGEFLALDPDAQRRKLAAGREAFRACLDADPIGFVAPAWLFNAALQPLLREMGFRYTEDHRRIYRMDTGASLASPVITWATRTFLRKYGSLIVCPALARLWSRAPVLRVAMHPFDFDHPETVRNIASVLRRVMPSRDQSFSSDLDFGPGPAPGV